MGVESVMLGLVVYFAIYPVFGTYCALSTRVAVGSVEPFNRSDRSSARFHDAVAERWASGGFEVAGVLDLRTWQRVPAGSMVILTHPELPATVTVTHWVWHSPRREQEVINVMISTCIERPDGTTFTVATTDHQMMLLPMPETDLELHPNLRPEDLLDRHGDRVVGAEQRGRARARRDDLDVLEWMALERQRTLDHAVAVGALRPADEDGWHQFSVRTAARSTLWSSPFYGIPLVFRARRRSRQRLRRSPSFRHVEA